MPVSIMSSDWPLLPYFSRDPGRPPLEPRRRVWWGMRSAGGSKTLLIKGPSFYRGDRFAMYTNIRSITYSTQIHYKNDQFTTSLHMRKTILQNAGPRVEQRNPTRGQMSMREDVRVPQIVPIILLLIKRFLYSPLWVPKTHTLKQEPLAYVIFYCQKQTHNKSLTL